MTNLGNPMVYRARDFSIYKSISGDLSYGYHLIPTSSISGGWMATGYSFATMSDTKKALNMARKYGYDSNELKNFEKGLRYEQQFKYLPEHEAKKYISIDAAYGEYVDKLRKKYGYKQRGGQGGWFRESRRHSEAAYKGHRKRRR